MLLLIRMPIFDLFNLLVLLHSPADSPTIELERLVELFSLCIDSRSATERVGFLICCPGSLLIHLEFIDLANVAVYVDQVQFLATTNTFRCVAASQRMDIAIVTMRRSISHLVCESGRRCKGFKLTLDYTLVFVCRCGDDIEIAAVLVVLRRTQIVREEHVDLLSRDH